MEDFKNRLLEFIEKQYGISIRAFEEMCNITNGTIGSIKVKGPSTDVLSKISNTCPSLNLNWLITGRGEMLNSKFSISAKASGNSYANAIVGNSNTVNEARSDETLRNELAILRKENELLRERLADKDTLLADKDAQIDFLKQLLTK